MQDKKSPGSSIGRAKLWRCLGYKFKSYLGHLKLYFLDPYIVLYKYKNIIWKLYNSLYSSMVERNTVNILINVRFILKAKRIMQGS